MTMTTVLTLSGCIDEYEADIPSDDSDLLVVEGAICAGRLNKFYLSRTQPIHSTFPPQMVKGAKVSVRGSDGSEYQAKEEDDCYTCQIDVLASDAEYFLHIESDGEVYESEPQKPLRTEKIADVKAVQNTPESNIDVLVTPDEPDEPDKIHYYSWSFDETWEVHPEYTTDMYYDTVLKKHVVVGYSLFPERGWKDAINMDILVGASTNYEGQHIQQLKLYDISRSSERIYYKYSGLVHQRAISRAEYEYELARRQASSEMGGLFTPQPSALPTNIHCLTSGKHVIGFVGCALNTSEYRFFLYPSQFSIHHPSYGDTRVWVEAPTEDYCLQLVNRGMFLCEWQDSLTSSDGKVHTAWAYENQLNVEIWGAYIQQPDFWNNDH